MRGFPGVMEPQNGLLYADLWLWIITTCNLLVWGGGLPISCPSPHDAKQSWGEKNPFDDVTRRQILELLCWQRKMRAGLRSVILSLAVVSTPTKRRKPGHKYSRRLRLKLSFPQIYLCQQMRGCNFKCCHTGDLSPATRNVFAHFFSKLTYLVDCLILQMFL